MNVAIEPVEGKAGRARFVDLGRRMAAGVPHAVPQLRSERLGLIDPAKNPFFDHAEVQLFVARAEGEDGGEDVGRISAHIDRLALAQPPEQGFGPGTGFFGYFDAADETVARALLERAESWLRERGSTRALGPVSLSIWDEPGLLVVGHDHPPTLMMGHHPPEYARWIEAAGYGCAKLLQTWEVDLTLPFPPLVERIAAAGRNNQRLTMRAPDMARLSDEIAIVMDILNDAWSSNWGFVPFTAAEIAHAGKSLKPIVKPRLNRIVEIEGEPVAFMIVLPDLNEVLSRIDGRLLPFGWAKLLAWLRRPASTTVRVPLMGVRREYQNSRLASQMAMMMICDIRDHAIAWLGATRGEIGWILDDNQGMIAIAEAIGGEVNREYAIYAKPLGPEPRDPAAG